MLSNALCGVNWEVAAVPCVFSYSGCDRQFGSPQA